MVCADQQLAEHETRNASKPWVLLRKLGWQPGFGNIQGRMFYNVVGGHYTEGSTVTVESLLRQGFRVEVVE